MNIPSSLKYGTEVYQKDSDFQEYVNRPGFHIVEYFNEKHPDTNRPYDCYEEDDGMFRFEKVMK